MELYNQMTTGKGRDIIISGWKASGIFDAVQFGSRKLPSLDPFHDIDPMLDDVEVNSNQLSLCTMAEEQLTIVRSMDEYTRRRR